MIMQQQEQFDDYTISAQLKETLALLGYHTPTEIQKQVIPQMLSGRNVAAKAPTGSGKTAAFAIPICDGIEWEENLPQALILEPARELAVQVQEEFFRIGRKKRLKVQAVLGGFPIDKQIQTLRQKSHVVVGTPGRIMDLVRRESLKLSELKWLVVDEADLMLDMGFIDEVTDILKLRPEGCKTALFSATLRPEVQHLAEEYMQDLVTVVQDATKKQESAIRQKLYRTCADRKYDDFISILKAENPESCIIFCGTREMVNVLFQKLRRSRIFCGMLHGELEQKERLKTVNAFRRGGFRYLIATDVAARGIDFENISLVVNYDFPTGRETYVHRIGRTGRNGSTGTAVSLVTEDEERMLRQIEEYTGYDLPLTKVLQTDETQEKEFWKSQRTRAEIKPEKGAALNAGIIRLSIGGGRKSKIRACDIVGAVCGIEGLTAEDIGIIDVRDSLTYVEILNGKGSRVLEELQTRPVKGKVRKVRRTRTAI